jgi:hypothetical protein
VWGGWAIDVEIADWVTDRNLKRVLMLGSGEGSLGLAERGHIVYAIEDEPDYLDKYEHENLNYIYAPLRPYHHKHHVDYFWYNHMILQEILPNYDVLIVDGPLGSPNRFGIYHHFKLFKDNTPMIFDDVNRRVEYKAALLIARRLKKEMIIKNTHQRKQFGLIE